MAALAPSILSADFSKLGEEIRLVDEAGAGLIHVDVMDGHFVPNITIGPLIAAAVRKATDLPVDCHLMIENPDRYIDEFARAGADMISVHVEAARHLHRTIHRIQELGVKAGAVLNPATPISFLHDILPDLDFVLLMSVNPGFGGQKMIPAVLDKALDLRRWIERDRLDVRIEIDGGVTEQNIEKVAQSGVDWVVAGSAVFGAADVPAAVRRMTGILAEVAESARKA